MTLALHELVYKFTNQATDNLSSCYRKTDVKKLSSNVELSKCLSSPWDHDREMKFWADLVKACTYKSCLHNQAVRLKP